MRGYTFECNKESERNKLYEDLYLMVRKSDDFKYRDIIINKWDKLGLFYCGIVIADTVAGSFSITTMNAFNKSMKSVFIGVKTDFEDTEVVIPDSVNVSVTWKEDSPNRYKIYYKNFPFIKAMLLEGATPEKIEEVYGVKFTPEECEKIKAKDKP